MQIAIVVLGVLFVGSSAGFGWALRKRWVALRAVHQLAFELQPQRWIRWWARNAAECTPLDPARPHQLRLALAAQLAPSLEAFERDLHSIQLDLARTELERDVAKGFLSELEIARRVRVPPWVQWKLDTGKPEHNPEAQRIAYLCALKDWTALLTRKLGGGVPAELFVPAEPDEPDDDPPDLQH